MKKLLILGGGAVTMECYLPALRDLGLLSAALVVDPRPLELPDVATERADFTTFTAKAPSGFDAVVVALPNELHQPAVEWSLGHGLPVLCEKPLALGSEVCEQLAALAETCGKLLVVNMVRRQYPSFQLAKRMIMGGVLGEITRVAMSHGSTYGWPAVSLAPFQRAGGGLLADMGVHYLDLAESWLGELTPVTYADDWMGGVEADLQFGLTSAAGVSVTIALSRRRTLANQVVIEGSSGSLEIGMDDFTRVLWTDRAGVRSRIDASPDGPPTTFVSCFARQVQDFLGEAAGGPAASPASSRGPGPAVTSVNARAAARTARLMEWAYANRAPQAPRAAVTAGTSQKPVCVTGGTGFIGTHLVERLASLGTDIRVPVRRPATCAGPARFPVRLTQVDLLDAARVRETVAGCSVVYHLAYGRGGGAETSITIEGTKNVVNAAIAENCVAVVILSTMAVYGRPAGEVDESAPYRPAYGDYGSSKARMERWCLERAATAGSTRIVVLNPTCVYGPGGPTYTELPATLARNREFCWVDDGLGKANHVYVDNLVDAILLAASKPEAHGQRFLVNDGTVSWRRFLEPLVEPWLAGIPSYSVAELKELNRGARPRGSLMGAARAAIAHPDVRAQLRALPLVGVARKFARGVPRGAAIIATGAASVSEATPQAVPPDWLADLFGPGESVFLSKKAETILGWRAGITLEEGQRRAVEHLRWLGLR